MTIGSDGLHVESTSFSRALPRILDITERALVTLTFMYFFAANLASRNPLNIGVAATEAIPVFYILLRKPTDSVSLSPLDWALAVIGTVGPMLARPGGEPLNDGVLAASLWVAGMFISIAAKFSLNRRFGVAPANRGVQARGAYAFIRHPMYTGYLLMNAGYLIYNPTLFNVVVYTIAWGCQLGRIHREEAWLRRDPAYCDYAKAVRFRVFPGLI